MKPRRGSVRTPLTAVLAAAFLALAALTVAPSPAHAAPVFTDAETHFDSDYWAHDDSSCTESLQVEPPDLTAPLVENGPAISSTGAASVTATAADATDVMTIQTTGSQSVGVRSSGGNPLTIDGVAQATISATSTKPVSACFVHSGSEVDADFEFTVAQAGFLTVHITRHGGGGSDFSLNRNLPTTDGDEEADGDEIDVDQSTRIFLTPGRYNGAFSVFADLITHTAASRTPSVALHATFAVAGTQSAAAAGKAAGYLTLPSARSCTTHNLTPTVTGKKKAAKKIKQITFLVNDAKVATVKHPKRGAVLSVPVADNTDAELTAVVQLLPKKNKKGKPGKEIEVSASYVACTS